MRFSVLGKPTPKPIKPSVQWVPGLSRGKSSWNVVLITHLLVLCCENVGTILLPLLCVFIGMSWNDLYLYMIMKIIYRIDNIYKLQLSAVNIQTLFLPGENS